MAVSFRGVHCTARVQVSSITKEKGGNVDIEGIPSEKTKLAVPGEPGVQVQSIMIEEGGSITIEGGCFLC